MADQMIIRKTYEAVSTKAVEGESRWPVVTISNANPDPSKDVVVSGGMEAENYLKNPVVAAFHRYNQPSVTRKTGLQEQAKGSFLTPKKSPTVLDMV